MARTSNATGSAALRRRILLWGLILAVASVLLAAMPGTDVLSFYFCLVIAPLLAMACGGVAVTAVQGARAAGRGLSAALRGTLVSLGILVPIPLAVILSNGFRVSPCDTAYGLAFYAVGPVASALCGSATGFAAATLIRSRRGAHALFLALFIGSFAFNLADLYRHPAVFFYNPFLGFYPGAIYDERIEIGTAYLAFRGLCAAGFGSLLLLACALRTPDLGPRPARNPLVLAGVGALAGVAATLASMAADFGFRVTRDDVERALSGRVSDRYCEVHHDPTMDAQTAARLLKDCGFRHRQAAAFFGVEPGDPIRLYVYRDEDQKARLMGARDTEISKPWLNEVHLTAFVPGDPVLGHEVAHVVAGRLARNFLALPLRWGVVPDLPVIEGLAVASAFATNGPSAHEWALAMTRAGLPADPTFVWRTDAFLLAQPGRAYLVAGSFCRFIAERFGVSAIQDLAAGRSLEEATSFEPARLVTEWHAYLEDVAGPTVDDALQREAARQYSGPGVLGQRCPVDVARALAALESAIRSDDAAGAVRQAQIAAALDPGSAPLRWRLLRVEAAVVEAPAREPVTDPGLLAPEDPVDLVALADVQALRDLRDQEPPSPMVRASLVRALASQPSGGVLRGILARLAALDLPPAAALAVFRVLAGLEVEPVWVLMDAGLAAPESALVHYLLARALIATQDLAPAVDHLIAALALGLPGSALETEAHRSLGEAAYWLGDRDLARRHLVHALDRAQYEGERLHIEEFLERLAGG